MTLEVRGLTVRRGRRDVISGLDVAPLAPGTLAAVVGPNGAGKSTLIHALAGLLPASGELRLDGEALGTLAPALRAARVGLLPQSLPLATGLSAYELMLGGVLATGVARAEAEQRIAGTVDGLGLAAVAMARLDTLSGGQRQMVALAQVLARRPRLMLLDEPTSALDLYWTLSALEAVASRVRRERAMALVAVHDLDLALQHCDRVLVLHQGRLVADGEPLAVLTPALLAEVYRIRARVEPCSRGRPRLLVDGLQRADDVTEEGVSRWSD